MNEFFTAFKVACYKALNDNLSEEKDSCSLTLEPIKESKAWKILNFQNFPSFGFLNGFKG